MAYRNIDKPQTKVTNSMASRYIKINDNYRRSVESSRINAACHRNEGDSAMRIEWQFEAEIHSEE